MLKLLTTAVIFLSAYATASPPNCAHYPPGFFVNDPSNCQAYWYCANAQSPPQPGRCAVPFNFDQANQLCNFPEVFPCYVTSPCPICPTTWAMTTPLPPTTMKTFLSKMVKNAQTNNESIKHSEDPSSSELNVIKKSFE
ncbi:uncharacterized protein LOC119086052 [Bradysia coprophila]|uniref:uncharacterized protein LOC119086052 n=1 Tax=Bradysia coprophila TaxID=38358 RepID=UPI00187DBD73|nr:uncharacterized protein LOC119086052 [Bradysia coprophila]